MILNCSILVTKSICHKSNIYAAANLHYILTMITPLEHIVNDFEVLFAIKSATSQEIFARIKPCCSKHFGHKGTGPSRPARSHKLTSAPSSPLPTGLIATGKAAAVDDFSRCSWGSGDRVCREELWGFD